RSSLRMVTAMFIVPMQLGFPIAIVPMLLLVVCVKRTVAHVLPVKREIRLEANAEISWMVVVAKIVLAARYIHEEMIRHQRDVDPHSRREKETRPSVHDRAEIHGSIQQPALRHHIIPIAGNEHAAL